MEQETLLPFHKVSPQEQCDDFHFKHEASTCEPFDKKSRGKARTPSPCTCICLCIVSLLFGFGGSWLFSRRVLEDKTTTVDNTCTKPAIRREWRSLSEFERHAYTNAVLCLRTKPSRIGMNHTLWDDFPYVHFQSNDDSKYRMSSQSHSITDTYH